jgi:hypothetical protein
MQTFRFVSPLLRTVARPAKFLKTSVGNVRNMGIRSEMIHFVPCGDTIVDITKLSKKFVDTYVNVNESHFCFLQSLSYNDWVAKVGLKETIGNTTITRSANVLEKKSITFDEMQLLGDNYCLMGYYVKETLAAWKDFLLEVGDQYPNEPFIEFHFYSENFHVPYFFQLDNKTKVMTHYCGQLNLEQKIAFYKIPEENENEVVGIFMYFHHIF